MGDRERERWEDLLIFWECAGWVLHISLVGLHWSEKGIELEVKV